MSVKRSWSVLALAALPLALAGCSRKAEVATAPGGPSPVVVASSGGAVMETSPAEKRSTAATLGIPPGHLPPPGQCRIWVPGRPPGHQSPPGACGSLERRVPAGAWLVYRPSENRKHVKVWAYGTEGGGVSWIRWFEAATGAFLRAEK